MSALDTKSMELAEPIQMDSLNKAMETLKRNIKIAENYNVMVDFFNRREEYRFETFTDTCGLWNDYDKSLWSCGSIEFSQVRHYRDMYKIVYDKPLKNNDIEKFTKAENFIKKAIKENREETMNLLYSLLG